METEFNRMKIFVCALWIAILLCAVPGIAFSVENNKVDAVGALSSLELSPDGRMAVGISNASLRQDGPAGRSTLLIWNVACLLAGEDGCLDQQKLPWLRSTFMYWISGTNQVVVNSLRPIKIDTSAPFARKDLSSLAVASWPKVMEPDAADLPALEGRRVLQSEDRYPLPDGHVALSLVERDGEQRVVWPEGQMIIPRFLYDSGSIMPLRYEVIATKGGFYFWSSSLGARGELLKYKGGRRRIVNLPSDLNGSLKIVFPPRAAMAVAAFTADGVRAIEYRGPLIGLVDKHVQAVRRAQPGLELKKVSVSDDLKTWALLFRSIDGAQELHVVEPETGRAREISLLTARVGKAGPGRKIDSRFVTVQHGRDTIPARLYAVEAQGGSRRLIIRFHGGPQIAAADEGTDWDQRLTALGFDVLDVDYHGSSGYGAEHLLRLRRPAAKILVQDLSSAVRWARSRGYSEIGFLGTSAGGLAGISALSGPGQGPDFMVLESPLIDWPTGTIVKNCRRSRGQTVDRLFGLRKLKGDQCSAHPTGLRELTQFSSTPVFLITGKRDQRTPFEISENWMAKARAGGACVVLVSSEQGGHTLTSWPSRDQEAAGEALKNWIAAVEDRSGCPAQDQPGL